MTRRLAPSLVCEVPVLPVRSSLGMPPKHLSNRWREPRIASTLLHLEMSGRGEQPVALHVSEDSVERKGVWPGGVGAVLTLTGAVSDTVTHPQPCMHGAGQNLSDWKLPPQLAAPVAAPRPCRCGSVVWSFHLRDTTTETVWKIIHSF